MPSFSLAHQKHSDMQTNSAACVEFVSSIKHNYEVSQMIHICKNNLTAYRYNPQQAHLTVTSPHPHFSKIHTLFDSTPSSNTDYKYLTLLRVHTEPDWISTRQAFWLWLILKRLWTSFMHMNPATQTHTYALMYMKKPLEWLQHTVTARLVRRAAASISAQIGKNSRFGSLFPAGQCFPKYLRAWFPCNTVESCFDCFSIKRDKH